MVTDGNDAVAAATNPTSFWSFIATVAGFSLPARSPDQLYGERSGVRFICNETTEPSS